ncbi:hypothetical protein CGRA01v4_03774 [Colletotrichum graminicola]|nr:hypothetical protein CGRA01v4_03774 [Colletotrichum graminicola]
MGPPPPSWHSPRGLGFDPPVDGRSRGLPSAVAPSELHDNLTSCPEPIPCVWPCLVLIPATITIIQSDTTNAVGRNSVSRVRLTPLTSRHTAKAAYLHQAHGSVRVPCPPTAKPGSPPHVFALAARVSGSGNSD